MTPDQLKSEIRKRNYIAVPFEISKREFQDAAQAFIYFLSLPVDVKKKFYVKFDVKDRKSDVGYLLRMQEMGNADNKEYFHYHPLAEKKFKSLAKKYPEAKMFMRRASHIYAEASKTMSRVIKVLNAEFPGIYNKFFSKNGRNRFFLRFLKYDYQAVGAALAIAHYDNGGCTLALAESAPGLRIGRDNKSLRAVIHKDKTAIFMPGLNLHTITSKEFTPAWHDVVQKSKRTTNKNIARWAIVFFADTQDFRRSPFKKTHTPIKYL